MMMERLLLLTWMSCSRGIEYYRWWWSSFHVVEGDVNVLSVIVSLLILSVVDGH